MPALRHRPSRCTLAIFLMALGLNLSGSAQAQEAASPQRVADLEKRVHDLEEIIRRMDAERHGAPTASAAPAAVPPREVPAQPVSITETKHSDGTQAEALPSVAGATPELAETKLGGGKSILAGWDNGFILRSDDKQFMLRITGQIQADHRAFIDDIDYVDVDSFFVRRARLGIEANMFEYYEFRLLPDFGQGQAVVQDAYLNVHYFDGFQVEAGKFKQPVSYEQLIQDRFVPTMERSMIDQLVPARDVGVMIHGQKLLGDKLDWAVSVSNGEINGSGDTNDLKDLNARVAIRPFNWEGWMPLVRPLQLGISGSTGKEEEPVNPNTLKTPAGVRWFQYNSTVRADGLRNRLSPEIVYIYGPFGFASQYYYQSQVLQPSFTGPTSRFLIDVPTRGWYVLATCLLTGEERTTYSEAIDPLNPFDPLHPLRGHGAIELVARVSRLRVDDKVFAPGPMRLADPTMFTAGCTELTLGFNWYLNKYVRTQFNWEHSQFDDRVRLGPGSAGLLGHQDALMTRFQVIF